MKLGKHAPSLEKCINRYVTIMTLVVRLNLQLLRSRLNIYKADLTTLGMLWLVKCA